MKKRRSAGRFIEGVGITGAIAIMILGISTAFLSMIFTIGSLISCVALIALGQFLVYQAETADILEATAKYNKSISDSVYTMCLMLDTINTTLGKMTGKTKSENEESMKDIEPNDNNPPNNNDIEKAKQYLRDRSKK